MQSMIGIGTDIVSIDRIELILKKYPQKFVKKILSDSEQAVYYQKKENIAWLAKRWAAKEAVAKALGVGIGAQCRFHDVVISSSPTGQPLVSYLGALRHQWRNLKILLSLSDEKKFAIAYCLMMEEPSKIDYSPQ